MGLISAALGLAGCGESNTWNQKLTVTVNTPSGTVSGSSVSRIGIAFAEDAWLAPGYAYSAGQTGEAVVVEVAPGKYLFALLDDRQRLLAFRIFLGDQAEAQPNKQQATEIQQSRKRAVLQPKQFPTLVTFDDIKDSRTVKLVDPKRLSDWFDVGYSLKSISLEVTTASLSTGKVRAILDWLDDEFQIEFLLELNFSSWISTCWFHRN